MFQSVGWCSTDLTLSFVNPHLLDDVSFHPCIPFKRWEVWPSFSTINMYYDKYSSCMSTYPMYRWSVLFPSSLLMDTFSYCHTRLEHNSELNFFLCIVKFNLPHTYTRAPVHTCTHTLAPNSIYSSSASVYDSTVHLCWETGKFNIKLGPKQPMGKNVGLFQFVLCQ